MLGSFRQIFFRRLKKGKSSGKLARVAGQLVSGESSRRSEFVRPQTNARRRREARVELSRAMMIVTSRKKDRPLLSRSL
jgi:hypothetical protein